MGALSLNGSDAAAPLSRGRYRLLEDLGHGGMATVYRGHDERLSRDVAVKVLNPGLASNAVLRARFVQEAKTMARLGTHPRVVQIYDFGQDEEDNRLFIAMELLAGTLQQVLERHGPLPPRLASDLMARVLEVLEVAHEQQIIHRDMKPSNILLTHEGAPKVGDFGIARIVRPREQGHLTRTGAGVGTWAYMAPEQKRDAGTVDHRADIYGAGATLFALLANHEPHDIDRADTWREQLEAIPAPLREVVLRATRYQPEERYQSAAEMRRALAEVRDELPPDPPGSEALLTAQRTLPPLPSPPTLVPDLRPPPPPVQGGSTTSGSYPWPPPEVESQRRMVLMAPLILLLLFGAWLLLRAPEPPPAEPPALTEQIVETPASTPVAPSEPAPVAPVEPEPVAPSEPEPTMKPAPAKASGATSAAVTKDRGAAEPAAEPAAPAAPELVEVEVIVIGDSGCALMVDGKAHSPGGKPFLASEKAPLSTRMPPGYHRVGCEGGPAEEVLIASGSVLRVRRSAELAPETP